MKNKFLICLFLLHTYFIEIFRLLIMTFSQDFIWYYTRTVNAYMNNYFANLQYLQYIVYFINERNYQYYAGLYYQCSLIMIKIQKPVCILEPSLHTCCATLLGQYVRHTSGGYKILNKLGTCDSDWSSVFFLTGISFYQRRLCSRRTNYNFRTPYY